MANDSIRGRQNVLRLTNKSGGGLVEGDVVIISSGTAAAVTTTTTAGLNTDVIGVALETIASDAVGRVCITGYVPKINLSGAASLGDTFATHTVAKQAAPSATRGVGSFGEVLGTGSTPAALLWGLPDPSGAGGVASDAIWDAAGDIVQGTGANAGARLAIGTAYQTLRVNSGATALEYVTGGRVLISEQTPTGTGTVTWSTGLIGRHLEIWFAARSTKAAVVYEDLSIYFNNDTTATNYRHAGHFGYGTNTSGAQGGDAAWISLLTAANSNAGDPSRGIIKIPYFAGTAFTKVAISETGHRRDRSSVHMLTMNASVNWESTDAITRVDLVLASGNYDTGSIFSLYGVY